MADIINPSIVAKGLTVGIDAIHHKQGRRVTDVEGDVADRYLIVADARTLRSWKNPSSIPSLIRDDQLLGLVWVVLDQSELGLPWLAELLDATSLPVPESWTASGLRSFLRKAKVCARPLDEDEIERVVRRLFPPGRGDAPAPPTPQQLRAYLNLVNRAYGHWRESYVRQEAVELRDADQTRERIGRSGYTDRQFVHVWEDAAMPRQEPLQEGLLDWLLEKRHLALLAVPGCGKSTALEEMAWELASRQLSEDPARMVLPLLLPLGSLKHGEAWRDFLPRGVQEALVRSLLRFGDWAEFGLSREEAERDYSGEARRVLGPLVGYFDQLRSEKRLVLLLDGLNELRGGAEGPLRQSVEELVEECRDGGNCVAVGCRSENYTRHIARLNRVELRPFDDERIQDALEKYLGAEDRTALWEQLRRHENRKLQEMLSIPLYVGVLIERGVLERDSRGRPCLPANRGDMLSRFARVLLEREWEKASGAGLPVIPVHVQESVLAETAYRMRRELQSRGSQVPLHQAYRFVAQALPPGGGLQPDWLLNLAAGAGLIDRNTETAVLSFWKEPLEEYFAAQHLVARFAASQIEECQGLWRVPLGGGGRARDAQESGRTAGVSAD
jgi:hypothetical protein